MKARGEKRDTRCGLGMEWEKMLEEKVNGGEGQRRRPASSLSRAPCALCSAAPRSSPPPATHCTTNHRTARKSINATFCVNDRVKEWQGQNYVLFRNFFRHDKIKPVVILH
eukprot:6190185-Pleurochrysis_carterae.AAC.5